jgi:hypothetical protein
MHATRPTQSDLDSINVPTEQAKLIRAIRDPLTARYQSGYPDQHPGTIGTGLAISYHGSRREAGR